MTSLLVALHESTFGPKQTFHFALPKSAFRGKADIEHRRLPISIYEYTP
jgi:hypothetical protein